MHEVLVNRLGGLSLPRKSVVRLTDRPNMTVDVYRGRKTTIQQQYIHLRFRNLLDKQQFSVSRKLISQSVFSYERLSTVQILCIGTGRSQQTVQTKIRLLRSGSTLFAIPSASFGCINAMSHQTFLFLGQLWQLFEVSHILEFLR